MEIEFKYKNVDFLKFYYYLKKMFNTSDAIDDAMNRVHANNQHNLRDLFFQEFSRLPKERRDTFLRLFLTSAIDYVRKENNFVGAFIDMNNQCNMSCANCINKSFNHQEDMTWDADKTGEIIDKIKPYTRFMYISGGEPFLNSNLSKTITKYPDMLFLTFTNGTMSDEYQKVIDNGSNNVVFIVSIDGKLEDHELKRGMGSYNKAIQAVIKLREKGYFCGISTVVNPGNVD